MMMMLMMMMIKMMMNMIVDIFFMYMAVCERVLRKTKRNFAIIMPVSRPFNILYD